MTPLVLLHGWGMSPAVFDALAACLEPHYAVVALPLPGYGAAPACEPYTLENLAAHVALRAPEHCVVAGWSLGGQVALAWARRVPQQVRALVLIATTPSFVTRAGWTAAVEASVLQAFARGFRGHREATMRRFSSLQAQGDAELRNVTRSLRDAVAAPTHVSTDTLEKGLDVLLETDLRDVLHEIAQPVLVVHGERDLLTPPAAGEYLASRVQDGRVCVVRGAAHAPFLTRAPTVASVMRAFVA
jgi:pimeloyl-[acyl-carrier protein] methyl ester esterase